MEELVMSAFLGPIHHWMYGKIQAQNDLIGQLAAKAEAEGWTASLDSYVSHEEGPLDEIIDVENIHGWLSTRIEDVECRYAGIVTTLLAGHPERLAVLKQTAFVWGTGHAADSGASAADCYKKIEDCTLNGMPCDGVNIVTDKDEAHLSWEQRFDVHEAYWLKAGGDPTHFYELRNQVVNGLLSETRFTLSSVDRKAYTLLPR
jgi:hypothetical protein